ncbi:MAG: hypothetical protein AAFR55_06035 [Pseudomonadota bacterium]
MDLTNARQTSRRSTVILTCSYVVLTAALLTGAAHAGGAFDQRPAEVAAPGS